MQRPIHIIAHSLGTAVALDAMVHLPAGAVQRIISLTGACYAAEARAALQTPAGKTAQFFNISSRENDLFEFLFERLVRPPSRGARAMGRGFDVENAVSLSLDCPETLDFLAGKGAVIDAPDRRISHWSSYTRPGTLGFYNQLLRRPADWPLEQLRANLPHPVAERWSRILERPSVPLPSFQKTA